MIIILVKSYVQLCLHRKGNVLLFCCLADDFHLRCLDSECHKSSEIHEAMKNIDKNGHTILYTASQSGKPKVLEFIMIQNYLEEFMQQEKESKEWGVFASNVCAAGAYGIAEKIFEKDRSLLTRRENECQKNEWGKCINKCEKKCSGQCVTPLMR